MSLAAIAQVLANGPTMLDISEETKILERLMNVPPATAAAQMPLLEDVMTNLGISRSASIFQFSQNDEDLVGLHGRFAQWLASVAAASGDPGVASYLQGLEKEFTTTADAAFGNLKR